MTFYVTPMLARRGPTPGNLYFMQTDAWYLERRIYLGVGINHWMGAEPRLAPE